MADICGVGVFKNTNDIAIGLDVAALVVVMLDPC